MHLEKYSEFVNEIDQYTIRPLIFERNGRRHLHAADGEKLIVPKSLVTEVLNSTHDAKGHPGKTVTKTLVSKSYWWPGWARDVQEYVRTCRVCQLTKEANSGSLGSLQPLETPSERN